MDVILRVSDISNIGNCIGNKDPVHPSKLCTDDSLWVTMDHDAQYAYRKIIMYI